MQDTSEHDSGEFFFKRHHAKYVCQMHVVILYPHLSLDKNVLMWYIYYHGWKYKKGRLIMFGQFVKDKRLAMDMTLREFCRRTGEDASNWSKIERGKMPPYRDRVKLDRIATVLGIEKDSDDWNKLVDYADVDSGAIPDYIRSDKEVLDALPLFFRTVGSEKPTEEELRKLIRHLRENP